VEPKTLGWDHSKKSFKNVFENLGVVPTPLKCFQKGLWTIRVGHGGKRSGGFKEKTLVIMYSSGAIKSCNHNYPGVGRGLVQSLPALVQGASHYIRVCRTLESGLSQVVGNSVAAPPIGYPPGRHLGSSRRGTGTTLDGGRRPGFAGEVYSTG
jgi:hypothetical protein